ncbi:sensor domain-containing diguanylate cyclase [Herbaspirillum sp. WKF16]|jgi:diguanylate cyclase (GGDEF)-like protein|uniref:sensor domain-containing diguanylate cyclase n=1 Tax=Herbaspirillum sp. WKF16 TaxID=3028312 RepID=UPI0023AA1059|nr:sensor domain-containing diguanylate cyclase [Herbaspirillum sp. WKF16]WDZ96431.1 sensor domain-containing diguanylate cyclase [Herbaspirillum sp. WKF16]
MTIRNLHNPYKAGAAPQARGIAGSRIQLANMGGEADAWLEPMLADFLSLAANLCNTSIGMMSQLHADLGLQHPFVSVNKGRGDVRNQWWRFPGQTGVSRTAVDFSLCEYAARRPRELTEIADLQADPRFAGSALSDGTPHVRFYAAVPLVAANGEVMGTLCVMDRATKTLDSRQRDAFIKLGRQLETQLESRRTMQKLEQQTLTDGLTGIGNRRSFDLRLREEWTRHLRNARPLSMLMVDVDYFKQYNDTYGHPAGDALLTQLARVLRSPLRASDFLARYGGDEFSLILPDTEEVGAHQVAERIKRAVAMVKWPHAEIEISLGAATVTPSEMCDFHALLQAADKAMYLRKHGRNQPHA